MDRRAFIGRMAALAGAAALGAASCSDRRRPARAVVAGPGPTAPCWPADANGIQLPAGFTQPVIGTQRAAGRRHRRTRGTRARRRGVLPGARRRLDLRVELRDAGGAGGASAVRFDADGTIVGAYRILTGTSANCAGGPTPWGTWLSCEENGVDRSRLRVRPAAAEPGRRRGRRSGSFTHEAAAVDPATGPRVPHRGRPGRAAVPLHAHHAGRPLAGLAATPPASSGTVGRPGCRRAPPAPDRSADAPPRSTAARGRGSPTARSGSPPRATAGCGSSTSATAAAHRALRRLDHAPARRSPASTTSPCTRRPATSSWPRTAATWSSCLITTADAEDVVAPFLRVVGHSRAPRSPGPPSRPTAPASTSARSAAPTAHRRHLRGHRPVPHRHRRPPPPPPPVVVAQDGFGRTVERSWGSADVGGVWTSGGSASSYSVAGGVGRVR